MTQIHHVILRTIASTSRFLLTMSCLVLSLMAIYEYVPRTWRIINNKIEEHFHEAWIYKLRVRFFFEYGNTATGSFLQV